jgi:hypothetical protein
VSLKLKFQLIQEDILMTKDEIELHMFLSSIVDEEIFGFLKMVFNLDEGKAITRKVIHDKIDYLAN